MNLPEARRIVLLVLSAMGCLAVATFGRADVFPSDSGVVDVTQFGVTPNDGLDDTAALQQLLNDIVLPQFGGGDRIVYLPDGVYNVSDTLQIPGAARFINIQGQSQDGVVLKLQDNLAPGGAAFGGAMFNFGGGSADRFENSIRNLTLDIGSGNAQAIGLQFNASNQGVARDLTIRSSDPNRAGRVGFDVGYDSTIGPLLVKNLTVEGFDTGIRSQFEANSKVFEDITVRDQNVVGLRNSNTSTIQVRNFNSYNEVPAIANESGGSGDPGNGRLVLVGGQIVGTGDAVNQTAIVNGNFVPNVYLRDVSTTGYGAALSRETQAFQGNTGLPDGYIDEYWYAGSSGFSRRGGTFQAFDNTPDTGLGLRVRETPGAFDEPPSAWVNPADFGGAPGDGVDDTAAIQAAIDSGARTVYLPNGDWQVDGTLELRGSVERLLGAEASLITNGGGRVVLGKTGADTVVVERISGRLGNLPRVTYEHDSDRTWVFKNVSQWAYDPAAENPGDLFLEDVAGGSREGQVFRNQDVWARQYNNETEADVNDPTLPDSKILVDGANVWILGLKTEKQGTVVKTVNGGNTELLGVYRNGPGPSDSDNPAFVTEESALSVAGFSIRPNNDGYDLFARETRGGVTQDVVTFNQANVYSAFGDDELWQTRRQVYLDNADTRGVSFVGTWAQSAGFDGGFVGEDFWFSDELGASATFAPDLPEAGRYEAMVRWVNDRGGQDHAGHDPATPITITDARGETVLFVDQRFDGGQWLSLGVFEFLAGDAGEVTFTVDGGGKVLVDGARFALRQRGDLNLDGFVDEFDTGSFITAVVDPEGYAFDYGRPVTLTGDINADGLTDFGDIEDFALLLGLDEAALVAAIIAAGGLLPSLDGDANGDGVVDLLDFDVLAQNFGQPTAGGASAGDFNGDGVVDLLDFDVLAQNFGSSSPGALPGALPGVVPEPASVMLLALAGPMLLRGTRRRS
ncbi:MAG: glycosyl hydrolase family 28-related protein [Planctomycetota bacterium]